MSGLGACAIRVKSQMTFWDIDELLLGKNILLDIDELPYSEYKFWDKNELLFGKYIFLDIDEIL